MSEFGATMVVAGNVPGRTRTIPLAIWSTLQAPDGGPIVALVLAALALSAITIGISEYLVRRSVRGVARAGRTHQQAA